MKLIRIIKSVRNVLFLHKVRVSLSLISLAVGIASVIIMVAIGDGARYEMLTTINMMGTNLITVDAGKITDVIGRKRQAVKATTLKEKDYERIISECEYIVSAAPTQDATLKVKYGDKAATARVIGTNANYPAVKNYTIEAGSYFNEDDIKLSKRVAVIGKKFVDVFYQNTNPVGEKIKINNVPFDIIGVLKGKGMSYDGANEDEVILIPLKTGMRRLFNVDYLKNIFVKVDKKENLTAAENMIREILREQHKLNIRNKEDDFTLQNIYTTIKAENETNQSFSILIISVSLLALIVGGIGILAISILSVKERNFEIGLRIAVGAKPFDIFIQFLIEAVILSVLGGKIGILGGIILSYLLSMFVGWKTLLSFEVILITAVVSSMIGVIFGVYPAVRAAKLNPIEALTK